MNWRTDKIVDACIALEDEWPHARRALAAARRSRRDRIFNAYIGMKRMKLLGLRPAFWLLDRLSGVSRGEG